MTEKTTSIIQKIGSYFCYALIFLLPFSTRYIISAGYTEYNTYSLYGLDFIIISLIGLALLLPKTTLNKQSKWLFRLSGMFWIVNMFSIFWSLDKMLAVYNCLHLGLGFGLIYAFWKIKPKFQGIAWAWVSSGIIQAGLALMQFFTQTVWGNKWLGMAAQNPEILGSQVIEGSFGRLLRAYGSFPHPNILGLWFVIALIFCLYLKLQKKIYAYGIIVLLTSGLFFTWSRQAALALGCGLLIYVFKSKFSWTARKFLGIIFITLLFLASLYWPQITSRTAAIERLEQKSFSERIDYQNQSIALIKNNLLFGVGSGNYITAVQKNIDPDLPYYLYQPVHNIYLLVASEIGSLGLLIFISLLLYSIYYIVRWKPALLGLGIIIVVLLISGLFDHFLISLYPFKLWLWLLVGIIII